MALLHLFQHLRLQITAHLVPHFEGAGHDGVGWFYRLTCSIGTHHHHTPAALDTPSPHTCSTGTHHHHTPAALGHTITTHLQHWDTPSPHTCSIGTHHHHTPAALGHTIITHLQHWDTPSSHTCSIGIPCSSHTCSNVTEHTVHHTPAALGHNTVHHTPAALNKDSIKHNPGRQVIPQTFASEGRERF